MSEEQVVHSNDNYAVLVDTAGYVCVNKDTEVTELRTEKLVEAIDFCEHSNSYIKNRLWSWIAARGGSLEDEAGAFLDSLEVPTDSLN